MQVTYDGAHSILIGQFENTGEKDEYGRPKVQFNASYFRDTWKDYGLIPKEIPVIVPPEVQENTIEVPGSNGIVDLSEVLTGYPLYYNRSGSLEFYVDHTHENYTTWEEKYDEILNEVHGMNKKLILTDAKGYFYEGRIKVNQWKSDKLASSITLDYNFGPYKKMIFTTYEDWLWDPFDFVRGTIPDKQGWYVRTVNNTTPFVDTYTDLGTLKAGTMPVVPDILLDFETTGEIDLDSLDESQRPYILYVTGNGSEISQKAYDGDGYKSYITNSERYRTSIHFLKHDPLITLGAPGSEAYGPHWGIRLVNPLAYNIKMTIDFRQGRL